MNFPSVVVLQYLDDILLAAEDSYLLAYVASYCRRFLTTGGFILNRAKALEWLGRHISTHEKHIYTNPQLPELLCANNWPFSIMSG